MIIHVSVQDLQRNFDTHSRVGQSLDIFAPGWRDAVDVNQATAALRAAFVEYWLEMIRSSGTRPRHGKTTDCWRKEPAALLAGVPEFKSARTEALE